VNTETKNLTYWGLMKYVKPYRLVFFIAIFGTAIDAGTRAFFMAAI
jgi:hypothetical protein